MVGDDVLGQPEPEDRHPVQHLALVGDRRRHHHVVGGDAVGGDHQQVVLPLVDLAHLPGGEEVEVGDVGIGAMLTIRGCGPAARSSAMLVPWRSRPNRRSRRWCRRCAGPSGRSPSWRTAGAALGDSFSVRFLGFERPMVLISDPDAIKALYREREHGLPPGRNIVLEPILGSKSLLIQEGAEHLSRRQLMLPPFHGERMRSYEETMTEIVEAEIDSWPLQRGVPDPRADAGGDAGGDPAGRLRRLQRAAAGPAAGDALDGAAGNRHARAAGAGAGAAALRRRRAVRPLRGPAARSRRAALRRDRRAPRAARPGGARGHPLDADDGRVRGRHADGGPGAARPADDAAAGRPRDDRDGAGLDLRPAAAPPGGAGAAARRSWRRARRTTCGRRSPSRCGCGR